MDADEYATKLDDTYRAIGRYMVEYSQLVHYMRMLMARRLSRGDTTAVLGEIALGEASHFNIAQAFFTMCRHDNDLDDGEKKVESALRGRFVKINESRTDYAHGDWLVGMATETTMLPPALVRVRPRSSEPTPEKIKAVPVETLDQESDEIMALLEQVSIFGKVCLEAQIVLAKPPPGSASILPHGALRVRDVLMIEQGKVVPGPNWSWFRPPDYD
jgi:hypothetical protein